MNKFFHKPSQLMVEKTLKGLRKSYLEQNGLDKIEYMFYNIEHDIAHDAKPVIG